MDDPNITMEEYIRLEEEKARRHGQTFNWQTATFGKVENYEDEDDCFIDFETEFLAIVFDNTLTAIPSEPTVCPPNENEVDFRISLDESDDEDYTVIFDENSFSYKIISVNDLKTDSGNDKPLSPNHTIDYFDDLDYFKYFKNEFPAIVYNDGLTSKSDLEIKPLVSSERIDEFNLIDEASLSEYDEEIVSRFNDLFNIIHPDDSKSEKDMMITISIWHHYQLLIIDTLGLDTRLRSTTRGLGIVMSRGSRRYGTDRLTRMSDTEMGLDVADTLCFQLGGRLLGPASSYVLIWDPVRRLCHRMIAYSISGRGQAPEKVTGVDLFYLLSMDRGTTNVPHLLAQYLFRHVEGRKSGAKLSWGYFIGRLAMHFGLGLERQQAATAGANEADEAGQAAEEVAQEILAPAHAPPPPPPALQPCTMSQRIKRIEEEVHDLWHDVVGLQGVVESFTTE
ncbi:hypothetical protein Tco_0925972 [Tanacetum coccineum]|uniref:Uncharacterized protein n=1 Tax=Tanacetum coccineum TaxID=301880 RepID=A0ABQ5DAE8_9ASTR